MKLIEFIDSVKTDDLFAKNIMFHFISKGEYPLIFFSFLMKKIQEFVTFEIETINLNKKDILGIKSKLSTSFLGQKKLYWLEDISSLKGKDKKIWADFIKGYSGPNMLAFFSDGSLNLGKKENMVHTQIDNFVDQRMFLKLVDFYSRSLTKSLAKVLSTFFTTHKKVTLDTACMIMNYGFLVGRQYKEFCDTWLKKIIVPEKSLFTLSQYFFDRNSKNFFMLWNEIKDDYSEQFWIVFWSEQIWCSCNVLKFIVQKDMPEARKVSFRLPFSFMQRSWRNFTFDELRNAHDFLYSIDYSLKNGGDPFSLDLFYSVFFQRGFVQNDSKVGCLWGD